jgi:hypothetical protein
LESRNDDHLQKKEERGNGGGFAAAIPSLHTHKLLIVIDFVFLLRVSAIRASSIALDLASVLNAAERSEESHALSVSLRVVSE